MTKDAIGIACNELVKVLEIKLELARRKYVKEYYIGKKRRDDKNYNAVIALLPDAKHITEEKKTLAKMLNSAELISFTKVNTAFISSLIFGIALASSVPMPPLALVIARLC
ncbi:MAG: hypothetical protein COB50_02760 [Thiotrichales bacterium]|nr:MAG: hypothetical protein COB50_02760 [Thiotrichales bacterium]